MLKICSVHKNFELIYITALGLILGLNVNFVSAFAGGGGGENMETFYFAAPDYFFYCIMYSEYLLYNYKIGC